MHTTTITLTVSLILLLLLPACAGSNPFNTMPPAIARQLPTLTPKQVTSSGEQKATTTSSPSPISSPEASQTATSEPLSVTVTSTAAQSCSDWANWVVDVTLPDGSVVHPGERMQKIWRIKNSGACLWNQEYSWRYVEGEQMADSAEIYPFADEVRPGEEVNIILDLIIPRLKGRYKGVWQLYNAQGASVGREMWLELEVPLTATEVPSPTITPPLFTSSSDSAAQQVSYRGVSFTYTRKLAKVVTGSIIPASLAPSPPARKRPEAFYFTFDYEEPPPYFSPYLRQLFIYPAADYKALSAGAGERLNALHLFIMQTPSPTRPLTATHTLPAEILDLSSPAAQRFATQLQPLTFQNGKGIRYISYISPHIDQIINGALFYTFQGLTDDGQYYISFYYPINVPILPNTRNPNPNHDSASRTYDTYLAKTIAELNKLPPEEHQPNLKLLDALIQSLTVQPKGLGRR